MAGRTAMRVGMHAMLKNAEHFEEPVTVLKVEEWLTRGQWVAPGQKLNGPDRPMRMCEVKLRRTGKTTRVPEHHLTIE